MKFIYDLLKSVKTAIVLIITILALALVATLIPQGNEEGFYLETYGSLGSIILFLDFHTYWRSLVFLAPMGLFALNLLTCTVRRLVVRFKRRDPLRLGPDIVHISLLMLIAGGVITLVSRQEGFVFLGEGDSAELPNGTELVSH